MSIHIFWRLWKNFEIKTIKIQFEETDNEKEKIGIPLNVSCKHPILDKEIPIGESVSDAANSLSATPIARKMADELGISLSTISGSGPGGRITKKDIELHNSDKSSSKNKSNPPKPTSISIPDVPKPRANHELFKLMILNP